MTYAINAVKQESASGVVAVKTGMTDPSKSWVVVMVADGSTHFVADEDVADWTDLDDA